VKQVQLEEGSSEPYSCDNKTSQETKDNSLFMNILHRNSGHFTTQSKKCYVTATIRQGHLKFRMYYPRKITKYRVLVRMVCEALSGYICKMAIYAAEGQKLEDSHF
jgi:hypothetical protein